MNRLTTLIFLLSFYLCGFAQQRDYVKEMEENDLQIRQEPSTEEFLANYLKAAGIQEDTVYAILFTPNSCPRCEVAIPNLYRLLKSNSPQNKMLLITVYEDSIAAKRYNRKMKHVADYYLYDVKNEYKKIFSFNSDDMMGLYVMKLYPKSGIMVTGGHYTVLGKDFVRQLRARKERLAPHIYESTLIHHEVKDSVKVSGIHRNWKYQDMAIDAPADQIMSTVYDAPRFEKGYFFYSDMLNNGIMLFKEEGNRLKFKALVEADSIEKERFVDIPRDLYLQQKRQGNVFYIALSPIITDDGKLAVSYSLPHITGVKEGDDYSFSFYNAPAIIIRDLNTLQPSPMISLDFDLEHSKFFYQHFTFDIFNHKVWLGCMKLTWPMDGYTKEDLADDIELNSFDDRFYTTSNPIMAAFDSRTGKLHGRYGKMEESQRRSKTGYFFKNTVYTHCGKDFLYGNGYTGILYLNDSAHVGNRDRMYKVFDIDLNDIPAPDSTKFFTYEYGTYYDRVFCRNIMTMQMDGQHIYCLVRYGMPKDVSVAGNRYTFVVIDRKDGERKEYILPNYTDAKSLGYGLTNNDGKVTPFVFMKDGQSHFLRLLN
ncbi:MAG: hypothetical protein K6A82_01610 [Prevotella sp.]|nr:hypothetical protein [Prevotella sp.]